MAKIQTSTRGRYILKGKTPVLCNDLDKWTRWLKESWRTDKSRVGFDHVGEKTVLTVFLGIDHSFWYETPLLFETMVYSADGSEGLCWKYPTWEEAEKGHKEIVAELKNEITDN